MHQDLRIKDEEKEMGRRATASVESLLRVLRSIDGKKTLAIYRDGLGVKNVYRAIGTGRIGADEAQEFLFRVNLHTALAAGGSLVLRRYTDVIVNDKPVMTICGAALGDGIWIASLSEETEDVFCRDPKTGQRISKEPHVVYVDFPTIWEPENR